jgi:hypothetical protein
MPGLEGSRYGLGPVLSKLVVHLDTLLFIPLMTAAVYLLVRGIESPVALICRIALAFFVVFYGAFEVLVGIGTGVLVNDINGLPPSDEAAAAPLVEDFTSNVLVGAPLGVLTSTGSVALIVALIAAGVASAAPPEHPARSRSCSACLGS